MSKQELTAEQAKSVAKWLRQRVSLREPNTIQDFGAVADHLEALADRKEKALDDDSGRPYWMWHAMLREYAKRDCEVEGCESSSLCITEWCLPCAARAFLWTKAAPEDDREKLLDLMRKLVICDAYSNCEACELDEECTKDGRIAYRAKAHLEKRSISGMPAGPEQGQEEQSVSKEKLTAERARELAARWHSHAPIEKGEPEDTATILLAWADGEDERAGLKTCLDETNEALKVAGFPTVCPTPGPDGDEGISPADQIAAMAAEIERQKGVAKTITKAMDQAHDREDALKASVDKLEESAMTNEMLIQKKAAEIERSRMQLVACSEAARANTREVPCSVALEYQSASFQDVRAAVGREMDHREARERADARVAELEGIYGAA